VENENVTDQGHICRYINNGEVESEGFGVKLDIHQGSVLGPLLYVIVLEALSRRFRGGSCLYSY